MSVLKPDTTAGETHPPDGGQLQVAVPAGTARRHHAWRNAEVVWTSADQALSWCKIGVTMSKPAQDMGLLALPGTHMFREQELKGVTKP
jgi:hypothetical protein